VRKKYLFNLLLFSALFTFSQTGVLAQNADPMCGDPGINYNNVDRGVFVYFDCGDPEQYHIRTTAGQTSQIHGWMAYEGRIETSGEFTSVLPFDIETDFSDEVNLLSPTEIYFKLNVSSKQIDGLDFKVQQNASSCLEVASLFAEMPVFLGANRLQVGSSFNLKTGRGCQEVPDNSPASIIKHVRTGNLGNSYYFIYQGKYQFVTLSCRNRLAAFVPETTTTNWNDVVQGRENRIPKITCDDMIDIVDNTDPEPQACDIIDSQITADINAKINQYKTRQIACPARVSNVSGILPETHGAIGDGFNDDTVALQAAIDEARSNNTYLILESGKNYRVSSSLHIRHGIKGIVSSGSAKPTISTTDIFPQSAVITLLSRFLPINMSDFVIQNIDIKLNQGAATAGILTQPVKRLGIYDSSVSSNKTAAGGIFVLAYDSEGDIEDVCIEGNTVSLNEGGIEQNHRNGISVRGFDPGTDRWAVTRHWSDFKTIKPFTNKARRVRVNDNSVTGGYYGIALLNTDVAMVTNNTVKNNVRNIRWGTGSNDFLVDSNNVSNSKSASFLNAYVSHGHVITRNSINTAQASSWGMIEMSLGTNRNIVAMNKLVSPTNSPSHHYGIYAGPHANSNLFFANSIRGHFSKSYLALEGSHEFHPDDRYHRNGQSPDNGEPPYIWQNADSVGNRIISNDFFPQRLSSPLIFLSQTSVGLKDTTLKCNSYSQRTDELIHRLEVTIGSTSSGDQTRPWR